VKKEPCPTCNGTGRVPLPRKPFGPQTVGDQICWFCEGFRFVIYREAKEKAGASTPAGTKAQFRAS
jgi:DnaJ-class molecular chaperone